MIDSPPEVMTLTVNFYKHLVQVPPPAAEFHPLDPPLSDLRSEHRTEPDLPEPDGFMANVDAALMQQIFDLPQREREAHVHHHRKADYLGQRDEVLEGTAFGQDQTLAGARPRLNSSSSDRTVSGKVYPMSSPVVIIPCLVSLGRAPDPARARKVVAIAVSMTREVSLPWALRPARCP